MTDCTLSAKLRKKVKKRDIHVNFDGGDVSTNGGSVLLKAVDDKLGLLDKVAKVFVDDRDQAHVRHQLSSLIKQRVYGSLVATAISTITNSYASTGRCKAPWVCCTRWPAPPRFVGSKRRPGGKLRWTFTR